MKKILFTLLLFSTVVFSQTTTTPVGSIKHNNLLELNSTADTLLVRNPKTKKLEGVSKLVLIEQVKATIAAPTVSSVIGLQDALNLKVDKVTGKSLILDSEITRLSGVTNQDLSPYETISSNNTKLGLKVDKVTGKSLILDSEITRLASVTNQTIPTNTNQLTNGAGFITVSDISNKVDKVSGKSLILDSEITRLATVTNQDISGKANDIDVIHKTGNETKSGILTLSDGLKLTGNTTDNSSTKVNVQSTDGTINTISKSDLVNVVEVNDVPSLPLVGEVGKIYVVSNVNKIYRWNGTFYQELATDISGKEDIANKQNSLAVDGTNTKYPTVTAVNHNLSLRANYGSNLIIDEALIDGYYIDVMGNGAVNTVEGYSITSFMEVSKTSYLLSDTYQQWAVYDSDFTFITGSFSDEGGGYVPPVPYKKEIDIPPSARYIRLTIRNIEKDAFYIARKNLYTKEFSIVAKKGGDFSTVQAAVNASFENQTIYIYPGVYEETVNTVGRKVKLIGFDKTSTKITTNGGSYYFPPLECSGGTYAENITFEATSYNPVPHTINAYAVHMDFEGEGVTEFNNCSLISHQNAGIGAGLHNNQTLKLNNCDIIKYSDGAVFNGGALYFHNSPFPNEQNQILEVTGCRIFTDNGKAIIIDDARHNAGGVDINTIMTFSNNRVYSLTDNYDCVTYSNTPIDGGVSGRIRLSLDSYGNSIDKLNKIKFLDNFANQSFNGTKQFNEPLISRGYYLFGNAGSAEWKLINDYNELNDFNIVRGSNVAFSINSSYQSTFSGTVTASPATLDTQLATLGQVKGLGYSTITGSNINQASFRTALGLGSNAYTSTAFAPTTGGTGYIQNQNVSAQTANMWISGTSQFNQGVLLGTENNDGNSFQLHSRGKYNGEPGVSYGGEFSWYASPNGSLRKDNALYQLRSADTSDNIESNIFTITGNGAATFASTVTATSFNGSATLTGTPTAPTAAAGTNTTQIATTAFVQEAVGAKIPYRSVKGRAFITSGTPVISEMYYNDTGITPTISYTSSVWNITLSGIAYSKARIVISNSINNNNGEIRNLYPTGDSGGIFGFKVSYGTTILTDATVGAVNVDFEIEFYN